MFLWMYLDLCLAPFWVFLSVYVFCQRRWLFTRQQGNRGDHPYSSLQHCVKRVQIRSLFWSLFSRNWTEYGKIRTRKTPYLKIFRAVQHSLSHKDLDIYLQFYDWDDCLVILVTSYLNFREILDEIYPPFGINIWLYVSSNFLLDFIILDAGDILFFLFFSKIPSTQTWRQIKLSKIQQ